MNQAIGFKFAQLQCEHALSDAGHAALQAVEALRAVDQVVNDQGFPFAADDVQCGVDGAKNGGVG